MDADPKTMNQEPTSSAFHAASCSRIWHGKPCGCKSFRHWLPMQMRMSYATPRKAWRPQLHNAHCTRCGEPLSENTKLTHEAGEKEQL